MFGLAQQLRQAGLRATAPRIGVLAELHSRKHLDTDQLIAAINHRLGTVSNQAVYDAVNVLTAAGLVRCIEPARERARYEINQGDNHHHLICRNCRELHDVPCATGYAPCLNASEDHGFLIDTAEVIYWGTCPNCLAKSNPKTGGK